VDALKRPRALVVLLWTTLSNHNCVSSFRHRVDRSRQGVAPVGVVIEEELHGLGLQLGRRCCEGGVLQEVGVKKAELMRAEVVIRGPHLPLAVVLVGSLALRFKLVQLGTGRNEFSGHEE
jgi:hypothetical protein